MPAKMKANPALCPHSAPSGASPFDTWLSSQRAVLEIWLDRLIAEGDPGDLISIIHRQAAWLDLVRDRISGPTAGHDDPGAATSGGRP